MFIASVVAIRNVDVNTECEVLVHIVNIAVVIAGVANVMCGVVVTPITAVIFILSVVLCSHH